MESNRRLIDNEKSKVIVYEPPIKTMPSPDYTMKINGQEVFVLNTPGFAGGTVSYISFDFSGEIIIEVTSKWNMETASVHPVSSGIQGRFEDNTITFSLDRPQNLYIKWNDSFELPIYIFANEIEEEQYFEEAENVIYFGPGRHDAGIIEVGSNQTVYIAGGAIVKGVIKSEHSENVKIKGRGILSTEHLPFGYYTSECKEVIGINDCRNVLVEGIIILDSFGWTLITYNSEDVTISNVKLLNERKWSTDGINPCSSRNVLIERCFIRSKDDCVSIKGMDWDDPNGRPRGHWEPIRNIVVKDCVFWSDNNNSVVVGAETRAEIIEDIKFINCDILKSSNTCGDIAGAISIVCLDDAHLRNITFQDIRVEYANGPLINFFFTESMFSGQIPGTKKPEGGIVKGITCKNITVLGGPFRKSYIRGLDSRHIIEDVTIENLNMFGKHIEKAEDGKFTINEFAKNIKFL